MSNTQTTDDGANNMTKKELIQSYRQEIMDIEAEIKAWTDAGFDPAEMTDEMTQIAYCREQIGKLRESITVRVGLDRDSRAKPRAQGVR